MRFALAHAVLRVALSVSIAPRYSRRMLGRQVSALVANQSSRNRATVRVLVVTRRLSTVSPLSRFGESEALSLGSCARPSLLLNELPLDVARVRDFDDSSPSQMQAVVALRTP